MPGLVQGFWYYYQIWHVGQHWPTMILSYREMLKNPEREYERVLSLLGLKVVDTDDRQYIYCEVNDTVANKPHEIMLN